MSDQVVGLILPGMMLVFIAGGTVLWLRDRTQLHVLGYVGAAAIIGCSFVINHYTPNPESVWTRFPATLCSITACIMIVWAACQRLGQKAPLRLWAAGGLATSCIVFVMDPATDMSPWLFAINGYCGIVFIMGTQIMAQRRSTELVDRAMVLVFSLIAIQFFARPIGVVLIEGQMGAQEYRESAGHAILIATAALLTLLLTASILAATLSDQFKALKNSAKIDELSGLWMRQGFETEAIEMVERAAQSNTPLSLIIADIDHFKQVNDLWGHPAGDGVIRTFGHVISDAIRPNDLGGRVGGEEFCILAWNCGEDGAVALAERLRAGFASKQHEGLQPDISLTASFGVAQWKSGEGFSQVYSRADTALYCAKDEGRNRVASSRSKVSEGERSRRTDQIIDWAKKNARRVNG